MADENPGQQSHRERLDRPVDEKRHADATPMLANSMKGAEVDFQQHGDDHQPDQDRDRKIDLGYGGAPEKLERHRNQAAQGEPGQDAERDP